MDIPRRPGSPWIIIPTGRRRRRDSSIELAGYIAKQHDRTVDSGKGRGGGLCIYINNNCCTNTVTVSGHCCPNLEFVTVKCRPFYLPREFTVVIITVIYIPPDANANSATGLLHDSMSRQQSLYPDAVHIIFFFNFLFIEHYNKKIATSGTGPHIIKSSDLNIVKVKRTNIKDIRYKISFHS